MTYEAELKNLIKAWEALPRGRYSPYEVEAWLAGHMKPAIDEARRALGQEIPVS